MSQERTLTLTTLLLHLRRVLLEARARQDRRMLNALLSALEIVQDAAEEAGDRTAAILLEDMACAARDSLMGVEWKGDIPSLEAIHATAARPGTGRAVHDASAKSPPLSK